jgi:hypothetical protein
MRRTAMPRAFGDYAVDATALPMPQPSSAES